MLAYLSTMQLRIVGVLLFFIIGFGIMYPDLYTDYSFIKEGWLGFGGFGLGGYEATPDRTFAPACDWLFQAVFAATAATIVSGAVAGRIRAATGGGLGGSGVNADYGYQRPRFIRSRRSYASMTCDRNERVIDKI